MAWKTVAEGRSIAELQQLVADMELTKGTKMKVIMDTPVPWAFDIAGAEFAFQSLVPDGMMLKDVYGEAGKGIVELEADPAWLVAVLLFIKAHWLAIIITGFVLVAIISFIRVMVEVAVAPSAIPAVAILIGIALFVLILMRPAKRREVAT